MLPEVLLKALPQPDATLPTKEAGDPIGLQAGGDL